MYFPLYIARRYLLSRKKHNAINLISAISAVGVMGGSVAFILVLSVFNGFEGVVLSLFNAFHADVRITAAEGKTFTLDQNVIVEIKKIPGVIYYQEVVEEIALLRYREKQHIATLKGVGEHYDAMTGIDTMIYAGDFILSESGITRGVLGAGVAYKLGAAIHDLQNPVEVYVPGRTASPGDVSFIALNMFPAGVFAIQQDIDNKYGLVPIAFMRELLDYTSEVTSVELGLAPGTSSRDIKRQLAEILGEKFQVQDQFQQQELLYKIIRSEKWAIFAILAFILLLAIFNIIGSLTMLILEKKKDIAILQTMGANNRTIRRIFLLEGLQISFFGVLSGLFIGGVLAWIQQTYGVISIANAETLVIDSYPVKLALPDFFLIFATVMAIGFIAAWLPVRRLSKQYIDYRL
ncbi:MAG: FtsX-like permease family protein [Bacteroidales bacterium]